MAKNIKIKNTKSAFSLIELSIVLVIISIIISGAITISESAIKNAKVDITRKRMQAIKEAINNYVATNKRLPCPASLYDITTSPNYGRTTGSPGVCTTGGVLPSANNGLVYGAVPVKDLGLSMEFMGDGFDNKFSYIVIPQLTKRYVDLDNLGFEGTSISDVVPIIISETVTDSDPTDNPITNKAVYALISHGANGLGAFNINSGSTRNFLSANTDEVSNSTTGVTSNVIFDNVFIVNSNTSDFDDIVMYDTREAIMQQTGAFYATVCVSETSKYTDTCALADTEFQPAYYGQTSPAWLACNTMSSACAGKITNNPTGQPGFPGRTCGPNGQWGPVLFPCKSGGYPES